MIHNKLLKKILIIIKVGFFNFFMYESLFCISFLIKIITIYGSN